MPSGSRRHGDRCAALRSGRSGTHSRQQPHTKHATCPYTSCSPQLLRKRGCRRVSTPLNLALLLGFFGALLVSLGLGRRAGRKAFASDATRTRSAGLAAVETVSFGLLGLLLAFTFTGAAARLDTRRGQIVDEANAIGTASLRIDVLPASAQPGVRDAMRRYTDARIAVYQALSG